MYVCMYVYSVCVREEGEGEGSVENKEKVSQCK
jgi:hypothetical protein